jgi:hypothetical protein
MNLFDINWQSVKDGLAQGLKDPARERLFNGMEFYKSQAMGLIPDQNLRLLNVAVLAIWARIVHQRELLHARSDQIVHELIGFVSNESRWINGQYQCFLSSKSKDREADGLAECHLDFVNYFLTLYPVVE